MLRRCEIDRLKCRQSSNQKAFEILFSVFGEQWELQRLRLRLVDVPVTFPSTTGKRKPFSE